MAPSSFCKDRGEAQAARRCGAERAQLVRGIPGLLNVDILFKLLKAVGVAEPAELAQKASQKSAFLLLPAPLNQILIQARFTVANFLADFRILGLPDLYTSNPNESLLSVSI